MLPRTVLSVFENVKKPFVFMLFFAMGPPLGRPGRQWGELLALQEGLIPLEGNSIKLLEGVLEISRALSPRFGRCPGGPEGEKVIFLMIFGRVKSGMDLV